jgi:hypothetical protein
VEAVKPLKQAEARRNLNTQLGQIQAQGTQRAFEQGQQAQQFGANLGLARIRYSIARYWAINCRR